MYTTHICAWIQKYIFIGFPVLTKLVSSKQGPPCRTLQWGGNGPQQNSLWKDSRPPEEADHAPWSSCSQHSASVPINTHKQKNLNNEEKHFTIVIRRGDIRWETGVWIKRGFPPEGEISLYRIDPSWHCLVWDAPDWVWGDLTVQHKTTNVK